MRFKREMGRLREEEIEEIGEGTIVTLLFSV